MAEMFKPEQRPKHQFQWMLPVGSGVRKLPAETVCLSGAGPLARPPAGRQMDDDVWLRIFVEPLDGSHFNQVVVLAARHKYLLALPRFDDQNDMALAPFSRSLKPLALLCEVRFHHHVDEVLEPDLGLPIKFLSCLAGITDQHVHFGRAVRSILPS